MKKNILNLLTLFILFIMLIFLIVFSSDITNSVISSIDIWKENVFPSLFPFFVISDLLIRYGFVDLIGELFKNMMAKLFYLPKEASFIIISSMLTGSPGSSKFTKELLDNKKITIDDAQFILSFAHYPNPLFVVGVISKLLNNKIISVCILISIILGSFITAIILRKRKEIKIEKINIKKSINLICTKNKELSFIKNLTSSILKAIDTLILLLGIITVFYIICTISNNIFNTSLLCNSIISGFLEMTQGIKKIALINIPIYLKAIFITIFISFGGISIHMQTLSILDNKEFDYIKYFLGRILHSSISCIIIILLSKYYLKII